MASDGGNSSGNGATPTPSTATSPSASGCPVLARSGDGEGSPAKPGIWSRWFSRSNAAEAETSAAVSPAPECPVKGNRSIPASIEEAAKHPQTPAPGQRIPLSTHRVTSTIPRGDDADGGDGPTTTSAGPSVPSHQPPVAPRWQYPSEQQFYNAMFRKGYRPPVETIPDVLRIHNAVNERSWRQVRRWERELHGNDDPRLVKFVGRPKDLSPRAWWNSRVLMTREPFDRHDWYVEDGEGGGEPRRYVVDFYEGKESSAETGGDSKPQQRAPGAKPPSMYIDVRPALDNPSAAADRMTMFVREALPGLAGVWDSYKNSPRPLASTASNIPPVAELGGQSKGDSGKQ